MLELTHGDGGIPNRPKAKHRNLTQPCFAQFRSISSDIAAAAAARENIIMSAFCALEQHHALLAQMLVERAGTRAKAARWMCARQDIFGGRSAYDAIADGDMDTVWDGIGEQGARFASSDRLDRADSGEVEH